jgi:hypothetical protein
VRRHALAPASFGTVGQVAERTPWYLQLLEMWQPACLLALNATSGEVVTNLSACGDIDDLFMTRLTERYICQAVPAASASSISADSNTYEELHTIATPSGARSSLFVAGAVPCMLLRRSTDHRKRRY